MGSIQATEERPQSIAGDWTLYIPEANGKLWALGIPAIETRVVQKAVAWIGKQNPELRAAPRVAWWPRSIAAPPPCAARSCAP